MAQRTVSNILHDFVNCSKNATLDSGSAYRVSNEELTYSGGVRCKRIIIPATGNDESSPGVVIYAMREGKWSNEFGGSGWGSYNFIRGVPRMVVIDNKEYRSLILEFSQKERGYYNEWNRLFDNEIGELVGEWCKDRQKVIEGLIASASKARDARRWLKSQAESEIARVFGKLDEIANLLSTVGIRGDWRGDIKSEGELTRSLPDDYVYGGGAKRRKDGWLRAKVKISDILADRTNKWNQRMREAEIEIEKLENKGETKSEAQRIKEFEDEFHEGVKANGPNYRRPSYRYPSSSESELSKFLGGDKFITQWNTEWLEQLVNKVGSTWEKDEEDKIERILDAKVVEKVRTKVTHPWRNRLYFPYHNSRRSFNYGYSFIHIVGPEDFGVLGSKLTPFRADSGYNFRKIGTIITSQGVVHEPKHARALKLAGLKLLNTKLTEDYKARAVNVGSYMAEVKMDSVGSGKVLHIGCHVFTEEHFRRQAQVWDQIMNGRMELGEEVIANGEQTQALGDGGLGVGDREGND